MDFEIKKEATYVYTYELDKSLSSSSSPGYEPLPFLFDQRDMLASREYIQCKACTGQYSYDFTKNIIIGDMT